MSDEGERNGLTIDEVAHETGMTARNIRAHQSRGLLPPPEVRARTGYYDREHVQRIRLIQDMQAQGFNLEAIKRLLELGRGTSESAVAFSRTVLTPFASESPEVISREGLDVAFGAAIDAKTLARAERSGTLKKLDSEHWEIPSPTMVRAARELVELGIPLNHALAVGDAIRKHTTSIAEELVTLFVRDVLDPIRGDGTLDEADLGRAGEAIERLRPLASEAVVAIFGQTMTAAVESRLQRELDP